MIHDLKPYPAYKDSGVSWLGEVPAHWEVRRLGQVGRLLKGSGGNKEDEASAGVPCVRYGDLYTTHTYFIKKSKSFVARERAADYTSISVGDVLFAASGETIAEIGKSAVNLIEGEACCGGDIILFRPRDEMNPHYMGYATDCRPAATQKASMGRGITVKHIYAGQLKYLLIALPPLLEQSAIVRFLDHADRRIGRYIGAKKKLIALLNEQKQAIIHRAVTRGLDPNVRLKPSGVEWLGEVPEHWEIWQIGHFGLVGNGSTPSRSNPGYWKRGSYPWLNSASVNRGRITYADQLITDLALRECHLPRVQPGSVLVAITGQGRTRGTAAVLDMEATINQHIAYVTPRPHIVDSEFLQLVLVGAYQELRSMSADSGSTKGALTCSDIAHFRVALPPIHEQLTIVAAVRQDTLNAESVAARTDREISLLHEYRTRLIADVVTGKLNVREAAARLPDEAEEPGPLDEAEAFSEDGNEGEDTDLEAASEEAVA